MKNRIVIVAVIVALVAVAILSRCGEDDKSQQSTLIQLESTDGGKAPQYVQPTMANLAGKEPPFPSHYPLAQYPNSKVKYAMVRRDLPPNAKNQVMINVPQKTKDNVVGFYRAQLIGGGWKLVASYENSIYSSTTWQKGDDEVEVRVSPDLYDNQNVQLFSGHVFKRDFAPH
jgi:hypothetical protein